MSQPHHVAVPTEQPAAHNGHQLPRIAIIGAGSVGSSVAYTLILKAVAAQILLVDIDEQRTQGEVLDLGDSTFTQSGVVKQGTCQEAGQADIVVITAGAKQRPGESRDELVDRNYAIMENIIGNMKPIQPHAKLLIVANPVEILTAIAQKLSGLPHNQVLGSGTFLDSTRLRLLLADRLKVNETSVHCYALGEHGDKQIIGWSAGHIAGVPILRYAPELQDAQTRAEIASAVTRKAYKIIELKGATYYGIAACVCSLCTTILYDQHHVRPVSCWNEKYGIYLSMPAVIGLQGVERVVGVDLDDEERAKMKEVVQHMRAVTQRLLNTR